ncbi:C3 and PZP-like alpha-2-macroglobulin domain-containing protein 8 [Haliotis rufescens]|uniref:C3 and PZP-like alpha-2-macroglobulin domain-containing protein 8 n=1 Tax=Haliotis rufescens TaxID=6454 RepID=UPI00201E95C1|nr:C3 and PZP-like alpha-2-macroglobulin domain-containing protein 8 [Haliotis rufescens]
MTTMLLLTTVVAAALLLPSVADGICLPFVELETNTTYSYQSLHDLGVDLAPGATSFKFKVRASNDVHVALLQDDGVTSQNIYEVVIGASSNTLSQIRSRRGHNVQASAHHTPLSASLIRDFWISWANGVISVGSGVEVGVGRFMTWTDPSPHAVRYIAVSTGWGSPGLWQFAPTSDVSLATNTVYRYQSLHDLGVDLTPGATSFTFKVRASNDAHVALQRYVE